MYILFDIGGTRTRIAGTEDLENFVEEPIVVDTPPKFSDAMELFRENMMHLRDGKEVAALAGGITGVLNEQKTRLISSPHHNDWVGKPLTQELAENHGYPMYLLNDTVNVGLGEVSSGAAKGYEIAVYVTISTGIGGARYVNRKIDEARHGFEIGHHIIDTGTLGTFEDLASGTAIATRYNMAPKDIMGKDIWEEESRNVAIGLLNIIYFWSPDVIVLGGGMMKRDDQMTVDMIRPHLEKLNHLFPEIPVLKKAQLGPLGGLYGAMEYIRQQQNL